MELELVNVMTNMLEAIFGFIYNMYNGYFAIIALLFVGVVIGIYIMFFTKLLKRNPATQ